MRFVLDQYECMRRYVIVEGFLLLAKPECARLFDGVISIEVTPEVAWERRKSRALVRHLATDTPPATVMPLRLEFEDLCVLVGYCVWCVRSRWPICRRGPARIRTTRCWRCILRRRLTVKHFYRRRQRGMGECIDHHQ